MPVDPADCLHLSGGGREERLLRVTQCGDGQRGLHEGDVEGYAQLEDECPGHTEQTAGIGRRCPQDPAGDQEDVRARGFAELVARVREDRFGRAVCARVGERADVLRVRDGLQSGHRPAVVAAPGHDHHLGILGPRGELTRGDEDGGGGLRPLGAERRDATGHGDPHATLGDLIGGEHRVDGAP